MSKRIIIDAPHNVKQVLLHSCCTPCSGEIMAALSAIDIDYTIFFYNPNIHPRKEYEIRKNENKHFAEQQDISFIDADYDMDEWYERTKGLEFDSERGPRCTICFDMRFERTALYAHENGFKVFASSMGISRWKDMQQVNAAGKRAAEQYPDLTYWDYNWRKQGGSQRMIEITKQEKFYRQEYCGCSHSLRETNRRRKAQGREKVVIGKAIE
ncbi:epoxyqueuosine reductase QueH [Candidatus Halobeggiatoa sp. HSG11]|nr:epoxyqueuosine reductase QueH [Candidatus Halobeggiatoa sp. HSG11]